MIAIAMAVYQPHPQYFLEQLQSIRVQTTKDWRCVLCWDSPIEDLVGSSAAMLLASDYRFTSIQNSQKLGPKKNFERAILEASRIDAVALACADQDDIWIPSKLQVQMQELRSRPELSLVHSDMEIYYSESHPHSATLNKHSVWELERRNVNSTESEHILIRNIVNGCTMVMDIELARRYPAIPESFPMHDHWYALAAACHGGAYPVRTPLVKYRQHDANVIGVRPPEAMISRLRKMGFSGLHRNAISAYDQYCKRAHDAEAIGLKIHINTKSDLKSSIRFMNLGFRVIKRDSFLAREAFKLAIGCLVSSP